MRDNRHKWFRINDRMRVAIPAEAHARIEELEDNAAADAATIKGLSEKGEELEATLTEARRRCGEIIMESDSRQDNVIYVLEALEEVKDE